jgi:glycosyltransferase involved in cell wall biosynthesis
MRIAMISEHASPLAAIAGVDAGGQNRHVAQLAAALARHGHAVTVYTRRDTPEIAERVDSGAGFDVVHVPAGPAVTLPKDDLLPFMRPFGQWLAERWSHEPPPDVVHAHFWMSGVAGVVATADAIPMVITYHALGTVKQRHQQTADTSPAVRIQVEQQLGVAARRVIGQCPDEVEELTAMGVPAENITTIPSGVDIWRFTPDGPAAPKPHGRRRILSVGRLVQRKGFEDLIFALRHVPDAELVIVGGPAIGLEEDPEAQRLRDYADLVGVADRVELKGAVAHEQMPALYRSADVVACTPWYEPFGLTPLEAMACGVPVVAYAVGGLKETIVDGVTGAHVPPGDVNALAARLREILRGPRERRHAYGREARLRVLTTYDWDTTAAQMEQVYSELVTQKRILEAVAS